MNALLLMFASLLQSQSITIPIQNPSFESPSSSPFTGSLQCGQAEWWDVPGWLTPQVPGANTSAGTIAWTCQAVPDGKAVAFLVNGQMSQDLGILPQTGIYDLKLSLANWFYSYPAEYVVSLLIGTKPVCSLSGYGLGDFTEITLPCLVPGYIAVDHRLGFTPGNLGIMVQEAGGWMLLIDNVSLTFTPVN